MHEVTVALSLLEGVETFARAQGIERVTRVNVRIGALSGIVRDALLFSWDVASAETLAAGSELSVEEIAPVPGSGLLCPACGLPAPRIVSGREMHLVSLEVPE